VIRDLTMDSPQDEGRLLPLASCHAPVKILSNYLQQCCDIAGRRRWPGIINL